MTNVERAKELEERLQLRTAERLKKDRADETRKARVAHAVEKGKFISAAYDRTATAIFTAGVVAPVLAAVLSVNLPNRSDPVIWFITVVVCCLFALGLHLWGREVLKKGFEL